MIAPARLRPRSPSLLALALTLPGALALRSSAASADPLAVHMPDIEGTGARGRPTHAQWMQIADAVSSALAQRLPDVLAGSETTSRIGLLDPAALLCDAPRCAGDLAGLLHARGVVLVRPALDGHTLRLDVVAVAANGTTQANVHGEATIGDWTDAVALGRVLGAQLAATLSNAANAPPQGAQNPPATGNPVVTPAAGAGTGSGANAHAHEHPPSESGGGASVPEVAIGGALFVGGAVAVILGAVALSTPAHCTSEAAVCMPPESTNPSMPATYASPSDLNWGWVIGGGVAALGGAILAIDGLRSHGSSSAARGVPHVSASIGPQGGVINVLMRF